MRKSTFLLAILLTACGKLRELPTDPLGQQEGQVLSPGRAYASVVGVQSHQNPSLLRVAPGDPANSYLYRKIVGAGITGDRMPQGGPYLNDAQIKLIRDWIRRGAPND